MIFTNPIEILNLAAYEISDIDSSLIKKAKRRIFAEIELSDDGLLHKNGNSFTRSDLDLAINQLDDPDILELFHYIANYKDLQNFLSHQDEDYILNFRMEAMYLLPYFISFISPYFAYSFDKVVYKTYLNGTDQYFKKVNSIKLLLTTTDMSAAYKSLSNHLNTKKNELDNITAAIRNKTTPYTNITISAVINKYKTALSPLKINSLPEFYQELRNQIAYSFRNVSVNIYNVFDDSLLSLEISKYSLLFNVTGLTKDELTKDFEEIQRLHNEKAENKKNEAIITKYIEIIEAGDAIAEQVKNRTTNATNAIYWVNTKIPFSELNALPSSLDEIKSQVALVVKRLSVIVWNTFEDNDTSIRLIEKALSITIADETVKKSLNEAKARLLELKQEQVIASFSRPITAARPIVQNPPKPIYSSSKQTNKSDGSGFGILVGIIVVIIIIVVIASNSSNSSSSSSSNVSSATTYPALDSSKTDSTSVMPRDTVSTINTNSQYTGNSLKTGASPFNSCFGIGGWDGHSWIKFTNDNSTDAVVCLVDSTSGSTIRNEYIRGGTTYKMKQVPVGTYFIKIYSGNDWNPNLQNGCGNTGGFESNVSYSSSLQVYNSLEIAEFDGKFTTYNIKLSPITTSAQGQYSQYNFFNSTNQLQ